MSRTPSQRPGATLGDYVLERLLGRGGMGSVFVGRHRELGVRRAIKVMRLGSDSQQKRFAREARALAKVDRHPGIVRIHSYGTDDVTAHLVLDLVEGSDLDQALGAGPFAIPRLLRLGEEIAAALAHVHAAGIVHRDLKPANVLLDAEDHALLTDFGVARDETESRMTAPEALLGTPGYMAPEQLDAEARAGPACDVFALGVLLYEMATGEQPFPGESLAESVRAAMYRDPEPPGTLREELPADLDAVILRALEKDPAHRPAAAELAQALRALARGQAAGIAATPGWLRFARRVRRREPRATLLAAALAGALVLLLGISGAGLLLGPRREAHALLREHAAWEAAVLDPYGLGIPADAGPAPDAPTLEERTHALEEALAALGPAERAIGERALGRLRAHQRLAAHRRGATTKPPERGAKRSSEALLVDALVLRERGEPRSALQRVERALARESTLPGRLLRVSLQAEADPRGFTAVVQSLPAGSPERTLALELSRELLATRYREALRAAPAANSRDEALRPIDALLHEVDELNLDPARFAAAKQQALNASLPAWRAELQRALAAEREESAIQRLGDVLERAPRVACPALLRAELAKLVNSLVERSQADPSLRTRDLRRALRADELIFYRVDPTRLEASPFTFDLLERLLLGNRWDTDLSLNCLRLGSHRSGESLVEHVEPEALAQVLAVRPRSRAARYAEFYRRLRRTQTRGRRHAAQLLVELEAILTDGLDDLAPCYLAEAHLRASQLLARCAQTRAGNFLPREQWPEDLVARIRAHALAARAPIVATDQLFESYAYEAYASRLEGDTTGEIAVWERTVQCFRERVTEGQGAPDFERRRLAESLRCLGEARFTADEVRAAERLFEEAIAIQATTDTGTDHHTRAALIKLLRLEKRWDEALRYAEPALRGTSLNGMFLLETGRVLRQRGEEQRARDLFEAALEAEPGNKSIKRSAERFLAEYAR